MNSNPIKNIKPILADQMETSRIKEVEKDADLQNVAQEFESLFVYQLLKNARKAKLSESLFSNQGTQTYESLLDQEYSKTLSQNHSFGIAEALLRQFGGK
tara:strand:+ start:907 stop:1206 length:300 start_codon:yes stop_codon:yes gene_type:complete